MSDAAMKLLLERRSVGRLQAPAPSSEVLDRVLTAAMRAPDHGALRPWRVLVIEGDGRVALGELMARAEASRTLSADAERLEATKKKALRAPLILAVACTPKASPKAPEVEQLLAAGCVAHTLLLALQAEGFGAIWRTGEPCYDTVVKEGLGLRAEDHLVGFLYVGTPSEEPPASPRPSLATHVRRWPA